MCVNILIFFVDYLFTISCAVNATSSALRASNINSCRNFIMSGTRFVFFFLFTNLQTLCVKDKTNIFLFTNVVYTKAFKCRDKY